MESGLDDWLANSKCKNTTTMKLVGWMNCWISWWVYKYIWLVCARCAKTIEVGWWDFWIGWFVSGVHTKKLEKLVCRISGLVGGFQVLQKTSNMKLVDSTNPLGWVGGLVGCFQVSSGQIAPEGAISGRQWAGLSQNWQKRNCKKVI